MNYKLVSNLGVVASFIFILLNLWLFKIISNSSGAVFIPLNLVILALFLYLFALCALVFGILSLVEFSKTRNKNYLWKGIFSLFFVTFGFILNLLKDLFIRFINLSFL